MSSGGGSRRTKHEEHEEHENHERWLVSYADMVTLLMVLFVVMFAMSQVDERKYQELKDGLAAGFGASDSLLSGNDSILDYPGEEPVDTITPQLAATAALSEAEQQAVAQAVQAIQAQEGDQRAAAAATEAKRLEGVRKRLVAALRKQGLEGDVKASYDARGLVLSLMSRRVVFEANLATMSPRGTAIVDALAPVLRDIDDPLQVDGHTNQAPGAPKYFATDWDLSAARAVTVLRRLNERDGIPTERLSLAAYGHTRPLVDPAKAGSQRVNKRVDIVVLTSLGADEAALLPGAVTDQRAKKKDQDGTPATPAQDTEKTDETDQTERAHAAGTRTGETP